MAGVTPENLPLYHLQHPRFSDLAKLYWKHAVWAAEGAEQARKAAVHEEKLAATAFQEVFKKINRALSLEKEQSFRNLTNVATKEMSSVQNAAGVNDKGAIAGDLQFRNLVYDKQSAQNFDPKKFVKDLEEVSRWIDEHRPATEVDRTMAPAMDLEWKTPFKTKSEEESMGNAGVIV
jgi:hypothetical protein